MTAHFLVLITGDATDSTCRRYGDYGDLFHTLLGQPGDRWSKRDVVRHGVDGLPTADAVIVTGSAATAHEQQPWMQALNRALCGFVEHGVPTLGICFGHQTLALALGGKTERNPEGWELGAVPLRRTSESELLGRADELPPLLQIHRDHVHRLPPGATLLAQSQQTPVQAFAVDQVALGIQGHPEFFTDIVEDLVLRRRRDGAMDNQHVEAFQRHRLPSSSREYWRSLLRRFLESRSLEI